jgi:hypothetical protein
MFERDQTTSVRILSHTRRGSRRVGSTRRIAGAIYRYHRCMTDVLSHEARSESTRIRLDISVADFAILAEFPDAADEELVRNAWWREEV